MASTWVDMLWEVLPVLMAEIRLFDSGWLPMGIPLFTTALCCIPGKSQDCWICSIKRMFMDTTHTSKSTGQVLLTPAVPGKPCLVQPAQTKTQEEAVQEARALTEESWSSLVRNPQPNLLWGLLMIDVRPERALCCNIHCR